MSEYVYLIVIFWLDMATLVDYLNEIEWFIIYLQKAVDDAVDKRIIRRLFRQNDLRGMLNETELRVFKLLFLKDLF